MASEPHRDDNVSVSNRAAARLPAATETHVAAHSGVVAKVRRSTTGVSGAYRVVTRATLVAETATLTARNARFGAGAVAAKTRRRAATDNPHSRPPPPPATARPVVRITRARSKRPKVRRGLHKRCVGLLRVRRNARRRRRPLTRSRFHLVRLRAGARPKSAVSSGRRGSHVDRVVGRARASLGGRATQPNPPPFNLVPRARLRPLNVPHPQKSDANPLRQKSDVVTNNLSIRDGIRFPSDFLLGYFAAAERL